MAGAVALGATLALVGCDKLVTGGNAKAPGSPGTGNPREVSAPHGTATAPGGDSGEKGSVRTLGSYGVDSVLGATGWGTSDRGGRSQGSRVGLGSAGGRGGSSGLGMTGSFPSPGANGAGPQGQAQGGVAPSGSANRSH